MNQNRKQLTAAMLILNLAAAGSLFQKLPAYGKSKIDWEKKLAKGYRDLEIGEYDRALKFFQQESDRHPESAAVRCGIGLALKKKGRAQEAVAAIRRATEVEPEYAEAHYELGALLESNKDYAEALKSFERYLQLAPLSNKKASVEDRIRNCKQNI